MRRLLRGERRIGHVDIRLVAAAILFFAALMAVAWTLGNRTSSVDQTNARQTRVAQRLCKVIYDLVARSGATVGKPGSPGYDYYRAHPMELAVARNQNRAFLQKLPCQKGQR